MGKHFSNAGESREDEGRHVSAFGGSERGDARVDAPVAGMGDDGAGERPPANWFLPNPTGSSEAPRGKGRGRRSHGHHRRRVVAIVVCVIVALIVALGVSLALTARTAKADAEQVVTALEQAKDAVSNGDSSALKEAASTASDSAHGVQSALSGPQWTIVSLVPSYGQDVTTARSLAGVLVDLSDNVLSPLASNAESTDLKALVSDGSVNVDAVKTLVGVLDQAAPALQRSAQTVDGLPQAHVSQLASAIDKAKDKIDTANSVVSRLSDLAPYLPTMLGDGGQTKTYLLVAQNNSEIRATGGFPGSMGIITVTDGQISVGDFTTIVGQRGKEFQLTEDEAVTFGAAMGVSPGNLNSTPNFERAGDLLAQAYEAYVGTHVDGTIAVDPVFLQSLLKLTGGVTASDGTVVDGSNAAEELLSKVYWRYGNDNASEDAFFAEVAGAAFKQVMGNLGKAGASNLAEVIDSSASERRLQVWMADSDQEKAIEKAGLAGEVSDDTAKPVLGVYFNDDTWAKMDWYLSTKTEVGQATTNSDGTVSYRVTTTVGNTITEDQAKSAPAYISGGNPAKTDVSTMIINCFLLAPAGGNITDVTLNGATSGDAIMLYGHAGVRQSLSLNAQQSATLQYTVTVPKEATGDLTVDQTPLGNVSLQQ